MIVEYHRPSTREEALALLNRPQPRTVVLGGGLEVNRKTREQFAVVDIQNLDLDEIADRGKTLAVGAAVTLQGLLDYPDLPSALVKSIRQQESYNRRQVATAAGSLMAADGRSPIGVVFYALDPILISEQDGQDPVQEHLGDILGLRGEWLPGKLITEILIPRNVQLAYEYVARTPADQPLVCAAAAQWASGRTRVILGGHGKLPVLALDGPTADGAEAAAADAYREAGDQWGSAEYRSDAAAVLVRRCLEKMDGLSEGNGKS
ncbi:MAG: FAD binding domain-containing protein [Anaerolineales bacterium]|nr:FAD binding domain-containing protein [Anaerolineales bacterium]